MRTVRDLAMLFEQTKHSVEVRERLLDLAIDHTEKIQRNVELDEQAVDQDEITERERTSDHTFSCEHHEYGDRNRDNEALTDVEHAKRGFRLDCRVFVLPQIVVVAPRLIFFIVEVLDRL